MILDYVESQDKHTSHCDRVGKIGSTDVNWLNVEFLDECTPEYDRLGDESIDE